MVVTKTYTASTMEEAQEFVDQQLGPNAVILTSYTLRPKGIMKWFGTTKLEVTAAVDEEDLRNFQSSKQENSLSSISWKDNLISIKRLVNELTDKNMRHSQASLTDEVSINLLAVGEGLLNRFSQKEEKVRRDKPEKRDLTNEEIPGIANFLILRGLSRSTALDVVGRINRRLGITDLPSENKLRTAVLDCLRKELAAIIRTAGPITLIGGRPRICAFIGPSGVGKTSVLLKVALQYSNELQKKVALIALDSGKGQICEQLEYHAQKFGLSLSHVMQVSELQETLKLYDDYDLVLIDTPGISQYQWQKIDELAGILSMIDGLETHLILSAAMKDVDIIGAVQQFSRLNIESLIFTKLDETISYGTFVNVCCKTDKSISYLTNGPQIPEDFLIANGDEMARGILIQHNTQEFNAIRALANQ